MPRKKKEEGQEKTKGYLAIAKGVSPGVYDDIEEGKKQIGHFFNGTPVFKKCKTKKEAENFISDYNAQQRAKKEKQEKADLKANDMQTVFQSVLGNAVKYPAPAYTKKEPDKGKKNYAYVDGSYDPDNKINGYGGFLIDNNGKKHIIQGFTSDSEGIKLRNVASELLGATTAIKMAMSLGMTELTLCYDLEGIGKWGTGEWSANNPTTERFKELCQSMASVMELKFYKVQAHSGNSGNEEADALSRDACRKALSRNASVDESDDEDEVEIAKNKNASEVAEIIRKKADFVEPVKKKIKTPVLMHEEIAGNESIPLRYYEAVLYDVKDDMYLKKGDMVTSLYYKKNDGKLGILFDVRVTEISNYVINIEYDKNDRRVASHLPVKAVECWDA